MFDVMCSLALSETKLKGKGEVVCRVSSLAGGRRGKRWPCY